MNTNELLKNRRKELGLTMKEVANSVGVSEATVSRWESGNIANMGRDKIALLSKVLKISPSSIAGYDDETDELLKKLVDVYSQLSDENKHKLVELAELYNQSK